MISFRPPLARRSLSFALLGAASLVLTLTLPPAFASTAPTTNRAGDARADFVRADEAPAARAYLQAVDAILVDLEAQMPAITAAADAMAEPFIRDGVVCVRGDAGLVAEMTGRAGALAAFSAAPPKHGQPVLYVMGIVPAGREAKALLQEQIADAARLKADGSHVVALVSQRQLQALVLLDDARRASSALLDTRALAQDGHAPSASAPDRVVPLFGLGHTAAGWAFTAELVAACARRGAAPAVVRSAHVATKPLRSASNQAAHDAAPFRATSGIAPIAPGLMGKRCLSAFRSRLRDVGTLAWPGIARLAGRLADVLDDGGRIYLIAPSHALSHHHARRLAADPGLFLPLRDPAGRFVATPGPSDFTLAIGDAFAPNDFDAQGPYWIAPARLRAAGRGVAWVLPRFALRPGNLGSTGIAPGELFVEQPWGPDDALLRPPGSDDHAAPIAPASGLVAQAILGCVSAQTLALHLDQRAHIRPRARSAGTAAPLTPRPVRVAAPAPRADQPLFDTFAHVSLSEIVRFSTSRWAEVSGSTQK